MTTTQSTRAALLAARRLALALAYDHRLDEADWLTGILDGLGDDAQGDQPTGPDTGPTWFYRQGWRTGRCLRGGWRLVLSRSERG